MASPATKEVDVSDITESNKAVVHGAFVGPLSPLRSSQSSAVQFFEGNFSDGKKTVRLVL